MNKLRFFVVALGIIAFFAPLLHYEEEVPFVPGNWTLDTWWSYGDWQRYVNAQGWFVNGVWQVEANMDHAEHYRRQMILLDQLRFETGIGCAGCQEK